MQRNEQAPKEQVADQANEQQDEALENLADAKEILQEQLEKLAENKNQPEQKTKLEKLSIFYSDESLGRSAMNSMIAQLQQISGADFPNLKIKFH